MSFYLIVKSGSPHVSGSVMEISGEKAMIGRQWEKHRPDICFSSPYISRRHAEIFFREGAFYLKDYSRTGTLLNGKKMAKNAEEPLQAGDEIVLAGGEAVLIFYGPVEPGKTLDLGIGRIGRIELDESRRVAVVSGQRVPLPKKEYALLHLLYRQRGKIVSVQTIKEEVWPEREKDEAGMPLVSDEEVKQLVYRLRKKLKDAGSGQEVILTRPGHGYMLEY